MCVGVNRGNRCVLLIVYGGYDGWELDKEGGCDGCVLEYIGVGGMVNFVWVFWEN